MRQNRLDFDLFIFSASLWRLQGQFQIHQREMRLRVETTTSCWHQHSLVITSASMALEFDIGTATWDTRKSLNKWISVVSKRWIYLSFVSVSHWSAFCTSSSSLGGFDSSISTRTTASRHKYVTCNGIFIVGSEVGSLPTLD